MARHPDSSPKPEASTKDFEDAFAAVQKLAADFQANEAYFAAPAYQESQVRKDFIDKLLIALGWDVNHDRQKNPFQQEVKVERGVSMTGSQRRADYAFYLAPNYRDVRFFVEAKRPLGDIATPDNCFQTIRYGWNAQTPAAVLTNFEQFQILDCRYKPDIDTATGQVLKKYHYSEYSTSEKFAEIYYLFSREAVAGGALEEYAATLPKRRGKAARGGAAKGIFQSIDDAFLDDLDEYRGVLARAFKNKNAELDGEMLTEITQRVIDRLVFIRFLEDKMIQPDYVLAEFGKKKSAWDDFTQACRRLDGIYNGIVFKKHAVLDAPEFKADAAAFGEICKNLSHANSPYDFNAIPIHILGSIYERFLGKVITTTDKRAKVEEKPEVRKAGGVYYTPEYIVRYIVENTVGKLIEGKTPAQIAGMRFADIACGSGSFLLGVFDLLLRAHRDWYNAHPAQAKKDGCDQRDDGAWHLSLSQRRVILLNNIYGVDIDFQAVEVAQLSLYLKLLEEETTATARAYQLEFHETLLPPLNKNIVCGNSLIGTDILYGQLFEPVEERKLNPMDYEDRFPEVMKRGGFDAIVGNPPYVRQESLGSIFKDYVKQRFSTFSSAADLYTYFIEKAHGILKSCGLFGYIVSNKFMRANYGKSLRGFLAKKTTLLQIVDFGELPVFSNAATFPAIVITRNSAVCKQAFIHAAIKRLKFESLTDEVKSVGKQLDESALAGDSWTLMVPALQSVFNKIKIRGISLGEYINGKIYRGVLTGLTEAFVVDADTAQAIIVENPDARTIIKPFALGDDIRHYFINNRQRFLIRIPNGWTRIHAGKNAGWKWLAAKYPSLAKHLAQFEENAKKRCDQGEYWWELRPCDYYDAFEKPKIIYPDIAKESRFSLDDNGFYSSNTAYIIPMDDKYLLGILNSKLIFTCFKSMAAVLGDADKGGRLRWFTQDVVKLPIRPIDFSSPADKSRHGQMVSLVEQMLAAKRQLAAAKGHADKDFYQNKCAGLDRQIDALVYELYGLTPEEIQIVEGSAK